MSFHITRMSSEEWQERREEVAADMRRTNRAVPPCPADRVALEGYLVWLEGMEAEAVERERKGAKCG